MILIYPLLSLAHSYDPAYCEELQPLKAASQNSFMPLWHQFRHMLQGQDPQCRDMQRLVTEYSR